MKKKVKGIVAVLILAVMLLSFTGCKTNFEIKGLINNFENACNKMDINGILDCITPKVSEKVKMAVGIAEIFTDKSTEELLDSLSEAILGSRWEGGIDFFKSLEIKVGDIMANGTAASVKTTVRYGTADEKKAKEATFNCVYYAEKWYIESISLD